MQITYILDLFVIVNCIGKMGFFLKDDVFFAFGVFVFIKLSILLFDFVIVYGHEIVFAVFAIKDYLGIVWVAAFVDV